MFLEPSPIPRVTQIAMKSMRNLKPRSISIMNEVGLDSGIANIRLYRKIIFNVVSVEQRLMLKHHTPTISSLLKALPVFRWLILMTMYRPCVNNVIRRNTAKIRLRNVWRAGCLETCMSGSGLGSDCNIRPTPHHQSKFRLAGNSTYTS
ncbi:MAG: hypothetical protein BWY69_00027 [Planctomycetes bacterium ADurb.Bin401]|nr:MAG: hypothetical protein BWY69_00027 [Planctomycetes bacterium ADurb.Bin401]